MLFAKVVLIACKYVYVYIQYNLSITTILGTKYVFLVSVDRWSLYGGALIQLKWTIRQSTEVSIDRWSFYASGL